MADAYVTTEEDCFDCEQCEISFTTSKALKQHAKVHPRDHKYICDLCAESFARLRGLTSHMKKHEGRSAGSTEDLTSRKYKSRVWNHFAKLTRDSAQCHICFTEVQTPCGNTSLVWSHLRTRHPDVITDDAAASPQPELELSSSSNSSRVRRGRKASQSASPRKRSNIWNHFVKLSCYSAKCKHCTKEVPTVGGNTSGARKHLRTSHSFVILDDPEVGVQPGPESDSCSSSLRTNAGETEEELLPREGTVDDSIAGKNKYALWNYFLRMTTDTAKCIVCDQVVTTTTAGANTELHFHMQTSHPDVTTNDASSGARPEEEICDLQKYIGTEIEDSGKPAKKSPVWRYFVRLNQDTSKCKLCSKILKTPAGTTSGPRCHLKSRHNAGILMEDYPAVGRQPESDVSSYSSNLEAISETEEEDDEDTKPCRTRSEIWNYFERVTADVAKCTLCGKELATTGGTTSGARSHMQRVHLATTVADPEVTPPLELSSSSNDLQESIKVESVDLSSMPRRKRSRIKTEMEDLNRSKPRKKKSDAWNHFEKLTTDSAKCKLCRKIIQTAGGSTSGARSHLKFIHGFLTVTDPADSTHAESELSSCSAISQVPVTTVDTLDKDEAHLWNYFVRTKSGLAKCLLCDKEVPTVEGSGSGLHHHMLTKHSDLGNSAAAAAASEPQTSSGAESRYPCPEQRQRETTSDLIADVLAEHLLPLEFARSRSFLRLFESLQPNCKTPCRQNIITRLFVKKNELAFKLKNEIATKANDVSVTTEIWRCVTNETYMSFTATYIAPDWTVRNVLLDSSVVREDHTLEKVSEDLERISAEWGIRKKLVACVHDGAIHAEETDVRNDWVDICCAAHIVHLCLTAAMGIGETVDKPIARSIRAANRLVAHFNNSPLVNAELLKRQKDMKPNKGAKKLIQRCETRWNSVYDMFRLLTELRWPIMAVLSDHDITNPADAKNLNLDDHWDVMKKLLPVMQALQVVTALLSSETRPSVSVCIPMLWGLINNHLSVAASDDEVVRQFKMDVRSELSRHFPLAVGNVEHPFVVASVLDPAHKRLKTFPDEVRQAAYVLLRTLATSVALPSEDEDEYHDDTTPTFAKRQCPGLDYILGDTYDGPAASTTSDAEVDRYLQSDSVTGSIEDVISWWKRNATKFPRLSVLARRYIAISPTSVWSERVLCLSGRADKKNRKHLTPEMAPCFVFLNKNLHALDE